MKEDRKRLQMLISLTKLTILFQEECRPFSLSCSLSLLTFLLPAVSLVTQLCPTLCDPLDYSPPASSVRGIFQAKILEWVAISSSRESFWPRDQTHVSYVSALQEDSLPAESLRKLFDSVPFSKDHFGETTILPLPILTRPSKGECASSRLSIPTRCLRICLCTGNITYMTHLHIQKSKAFLLVLL